MTRVPSFSVVMPARDTEATIGAAIASVLSQTRDDFELIVVDDGSTDSTCGMVERHLADSRVRLLRRGTSDGPGAARNEAIALSRAPFLSMLDSDDVWLPRYLETVGAALAAHPGAGFACTGHWVLEEPPGLVRRERRPASNLVLDADELLLRLARENFVVNSTVTVRRAIVEAVGRCNTRLRAAVDFDLWLRVAAAGHGAVCRRERLAVYRVRRGSIQNDPGNELRALRNLQAVYETLAADPDARTAVRELAVERIDWVAMRIDRLQRPPAAVRLVRLVRPPARTAKRSLLRRRIWYATPPPELADALPEPAQTEPV